MEFLTTDKFDNDFKKLFKKYKSLDQDLKLFKTLITKLIATITIQSTNHHAILYRNQQHTLFVFKSRLACRSLKKSSLRLIYIYKPNQDQIIFVQIYFKGNRVNEESSRWQEWIE